MSIFSLWDWLLHRSGYVRTLLILKSLSSRTNAITIWTTLLGLIIEALYGRGWNYLFLQRREALNIMHSPHRPQKRQQLRSTTQETRNLAVQQWLSAQKTSHQRGIYDISSSSLESVADAESREVKEFKLSFLYHNLICHFYPLLIEYHTQYHLDSFCQMLIEFDFWMDLSQGQIPGIPDISHDLATPW